MRHASVRPSARDKKLNSFFETYEAKSNWERYFAEEIEVENLYEKWKELYGYRNRVAHAKRVNSKDYGIAKKLLDELRTAFEKCLDHIDAVEMTEEQAEAVQEVAKETIRRPTKITIDSEKWETKYPGMFSSIAELGTVVSRSASQIDLGSLSTSVLQFANQSHNLMDGAEIVSSGLMVSEKKESQFKLPADTDHRIYKAAEPVYRIDDISLHDSESFYTKKGLF